MTQPPLASLATCTRKSVNTRAHTRARTRASSDRPRLLAVVAVAATTVDRRDKKQTICRSLSCAACFVAIDRRPRPRLRARARSPLLLRAAAAAVAVAAVTSTRGALRVRVARRDRCSRCLRRFRDR